MKVLFLETGGTIDKEYNPLNGELDFPKQNLLEMIKRGRCTLDYSIKKIMLKDSLEIKLKDRLLIAKKCQDAKEKRIIISHGTDTIIETAKVIASKIRDKTVVLFGAMIPYKVNNSDALFNLGCALSSVQILPNGVFIVMNGKIFSSDKVKKNRKKGIFEAKTSFFRRL